MATTTINVARSMGQQGTLCSRADHLRRSSAISIVQRLTQREYSVRNLGILIHQHYGYQMCYEYRGNFGTRSFKRRFLSYYAVASFCIAISTCPLEGMASCITARDEFGPVRTGALLQRCMTGPCFAERSSTSPYLPGLTSRGTP
jgi:hypothetical protein